MYKLIPNWIKEKITGWAIQLLNIETFSEEQRQEIKDLMEKDSESAMNRMVEIFKETTKKQQETINELIKENQELKEKLKEFEEERERINQALDEAGEVAKILNETLANSEQEAYIEINEN
jgi:mevalonate kinase